MQEYTGVCRSIQEYAGVYRSMQECAGVNRSINTLQDKTYKRVPVVSRVVI